MTKVSVVIHYRFLDFTIYVTGYIIFMLINCIWHIGAQAVESQRGNSKTLRLFGVNMECQLDSDWSEPSTPDGSNTYTTNHDQFHFYPQQQHYPPPYYMVR
jgi:hypothetical protein